MRMAKQLTNWQEYQPLVEAKAKVEKLKAEGVVLEAKADSSIQALDKARHEFEDWEAGQLAGTSGNLTREKMQKIRTDAEAAESEAHRALRLNVRARELLGEQILQCEADAKLEAHRNIVKQYKEALRRMIDALTAAGKANAEVEGLYRELAGFEGSSARIFFWDDFRLPAQGFNFPKSRVSEWLKQAKEYVNE